MKICEIAWGAARGIVGGRGKGGGGGVEPALREWEAGEVGGITVNINY